MKQLLLSMGLLLGGASSWAQAPSWELRNITGYIQTPGSHYALQTVTVNATTAWHLMAETGADLGLESASHLARTTNGITWTYLPIAGTPGYEALHLTAVDASTAYVAQVGTGRGGGPSGGGEILRTTDGGQTWRKVTTTEFTGVGSFLYWVHFFDATSGLAFGAPVDGSFEVYRTTDAAATWQRVPASNLPAPLPGERGAWYYYALGNTVWVGTGNGAGLGAAPVRIFKSADRGLTWSTSAPTDLTGYVASLAFKDPDNGLAYSVNGNSGQGTLIRTNDGGATWARSVPASGNGLGRMYFGKLDAIPGAFLSIGVSGTVWGSSVSLDGRSWSDIGPGKPDYPHLLSFDALSPTVAFASTWTESPWDYAYPPGAGGFYQLSGNLLYNLVTATSGRKPAQSITVYPNPSASGIFALLLPAAVEGTAHLRILDLLGREVMSRQLKLSRATNPPQVTVDLSQVPSGLYTLEIDQGAVIERMPVWRE